MKNYRFSYKGKIFNSFKALAEYLEIGSNELIDLVQKEEGRTQFKKFMTLNENIIIQKNFKIDIERGYPNTIKFKGKNFSSKSDLAKYLKIVENDSKEEN